MKLVESDRRGPNDSDEDIETTTPPRPEHRRVSVSLLLTASVLIGTVVAIYLVFPERHNALLTRGLELHNSPPAFQLEMVSQNELRDWSVKLFEGTSHRVPWPELKGGGVELLGVANESILARRAALARYRLGDHEMTLVVLRARDAPPRTHQRNEGAISAVSWRKGRWTFVAVGQAEHRKTWGQLVDAP